MPYEGFVDVVNTSGIYGWVYDSSSPDNPVAVEILADGEVVATLEAKYLRPDLAAAGKGNGAHAFSYARKGVSPSATLDVRVKGTGHFLPVSAAPTIGFQPDESGQAIAQRYLNGTGIEMGALSYPHEGFVDVVSTSGIYGWVYDSSSPDNPVAVEILADGEVVATLEAKYLRPDLAAAGKGNGAHAFSYARKGVSPSAALNARVKGTGHFLPVSAAPTTGFQPDESRQAIAQRYLNGTGIEIGALSYPLVVPSNAQVRYVDRMSVSQLRQQYSSLADKPLVHVDLIMDGETLPGIPDASEDFVIANHFIEHTQNPLLTIQHFIRVLRPGGVIFLAVPHKCHTFDRDRPVTPLEHVVRDYHDGPEWSRQRHFEEWARFVVKTPETDVVAMAEHLIQIDYSIHFHVWTEIEFLEMLVYGRKALGLPFSIELSQYLGNEIVLIISKNKS